MYRFRHNPNRPRSLIQTSVLNLIGFAPWSSAFGQGLIGRVGQERDHQDLETARIDHAIIILRDFLQSRNKVVAMRMSVALTLFVCTGTVLVALSPPASSMPVAMPGHLDTTEKLSQRTVERVGGPWRRHQPYYDYYSGDYRPYPYRRYYTYQRPHHRPYYPYFRFSRPPGVITLWRPSDPRRGP